MHYLEFFSDLLLEHTAEILPRVFAALEKETDPMSGVHFSRGLPKTDIKTGVPNYSSLEPHLGINYRPSHHDPLGIYVFPKKYVLGGGLKDNRGFYNSKYWYIIRPRKERCKILNLSKVSEEQLKSLLVKMKIPETYLTDQGVYHKSGDNTAGHRLWGMMEKYMHDQGKVGSKHNNIWNKLFKMANVNVLVDDGDSIIHPNEPSQMVYMEPGTYEVVDLGEKERGAALIREIVKQFPDYRLRKTTKRNDPDDYIVTLYHPEKKGLEIHLQYSTSHYRQLKVNIYGLEKEKSMTYSPEPSYTSDYSGDINANKISQDIKNHIETNKDTYKPGYGNDNTRSDAQLMKKISEYYKIALDPKDFRRIAKQYDYKGYPVKFVLFAYDNKLQIAIEKRIPYSSYNYYHISAIDFTLYGGNDVESVMKAAFQSLEDQVEASKPYSNDTDWTFEDKKKSALNTIKFLKERVFVKRA